MKTEDIDKRINMPDVDAEWARFEKEVIGRKINSVKKIWLGGLSIAASIILVTGLFLLGLNNKETKQILSKVEERSAITEPSENQSVEPETELTLTEASRSPRTEKKEKTAACSFNVDSLAFVSVDSALQEQIAGMDIVPNSGHLGSGTTMRLRGTEPIKESEQMLLAYSDFDDREHGPYPSESYDFCFKDDKGLQGQIAGLPSDPVSDIRLVKNRRRKINKQAQDTVLIVVNGKEDKEFLQYLGKMPYWSMAFIYDYFFQRNQVFLWQKLSTGAEVKNYAPLFNGRKIGRVVDYLTLPYKPVSQFTSKEFEARRLAYLLRCYQEGKNSQNYGGMLAPDLFDTSAEERLFGLLSAKHHAIKGECFGHVSSDSRGIFIPLTRYACIKVTDEIWQENGEWVGMEDDPLFNAVIKELEQAANGASSSLVEHGDSIVKMAFIYGGKVTKGAPHESEIHDRELHKKVKESTFEFKPEEDAQSYWSAEIYYSTRFPRHMDVHLRSVDKLYATDCPDILNISYKHLTGVVLDEEGNPLSIATIGYQDRPYFSSGVPTDSLGRFELTLPNSIDTIRVKSIGYQTQYLHVHPTDSVLTIRLKETDWKGLRESFKKKK
ncbi:MAG: carboxypeptidase-like regulatory domain-containing protein [Bacteroidaceae bacterium]|nr:carboxypeptidase-like regulatory domain-containing protein [Bacteroidaceae bacterium]